MKFRIGRHAPLALLATAYTTSGTSTAITGAAKDCGNWSSVSIDCDVRQCQAGCTEILQVPLDLILWVCGERQL